MPFLPFFTNQVHRLCGQRSTGRDHPGLFIVVRLQRFAGFIREAAPG